jgi:hypothetical protein
MHGLALLAATNGLSGPALILVVLGTLISAAWCVGNAMHWVAGAVTSLEIMPDGTGTWSDRRGESHSASVVKVSWCGESVIVIGLWRKGTRWHWLILTTDSAEPEDLRSLRVWARWRPD